MSDTLSVPDAEARAGQTAAAARARSAGPLGDSRPSGFGGPTVFDTALAAPVGRTAPRSPFDACHVGVVLRTLVAVHAAVGIGLLFVAADPASWLTLAASAASTTLPAVLLWLLLACAAKRWLSRWPAPSQAVAAALLGAACALAGAAPGWVLGGEAPDVARSLALVLAGAALALAIFHWLQLRVDATLPAATTARLAELQSRIRPHFLFNTLNTALALVRLDPARAETVLEDLAELFRVAISHADMSTTLAEEIELARRYLAIEQIRFGARLVVSWELDAAAGGARVPPLLLQPLVENAVRHGVEPAAAGGVLRVRTQVRQGRACLSIVNSVPALPSLPGQGVALKNVRERLRLMHDVAADFEVRRADGVFRVEIAVPLEAA